ncbi:MAG TPA: hypothetical protein VGO78_18055 [Acidimicrobiales bacterium]|nr:hypothetical protein [Acidimicrobiales bacterium]
MALGVVGQQGPQGGVGVGAGQRHHLAPLLARGHAGQGPQLGRVGAGQRDLDGAAAHHGLDLGGGPVGHHPALGHQHDAVGVEIGLLQVVGGEDHGLGPLADGPHRPPEGLAGLDVHGHGGLVQHQQVGVRHQGHGEAGPLGLAAGQLVGALVGEGIDAGQGQHLVERQRPGVERAHHREQLADAQVADQAPGLEHGADRAGGDGLGRGTSLEQHLAPVGRGQAEQHVEGGGLAGAVGSEQGHDLAVADGQVEVAHGPDRPERLGHARQLDHRPGRAPGRCQGRKGGHGLSVLPGGLGR